MSDARALDLLAARAFPAAEVEPRDGWLLRATPGVDRRRVISALPPERARGDAIAGVEAWYRDRAMVPRVMVTPAEEQGALDAGLAERGWSLDTAVTVLVADAIDLVSTGHAVVPAGLEGFEPRSVLERCPDRVVGLRTADDAGSVVAILQDGWCQVLSLHVDPAQRRRGVGASLLAACGAMAAGRRLYLQVELANAAALALYRAAGFIRSHDYHYREAPPG